MSRTIDEANREISRVRDMPYGLARTQAAERQVRLVDAEGPDAARAFALSTLVEAYQWGGEVDRSFVAFARLLQWWDQHPEHFDEYDRHGLFWSFKWMISGLADFPTVPAEQIDRTLADMERRYALAGNGMDAVAYERFAWARQRGTTTPRRPTRRGSRRRATTTRSARRAIRATGPRGCCRPTAWTRASG